MNMPICITTWPSVREPRGRLIRSTREEFARRARGPRITGVQKHALPRWAPARFVDNYRRLANVIDLGAIVADIDADTRPEQIAAGLRRFAGFAHITSTPGHWRIVIWPSRVILACEYPRVWRALAITAEREGLAFDYSASDASRAWAVDMQRRAFITLLGAATAAEPLVPRRHCRSCGEGPVQW